MTLHRIVAALGGDLYSGGRRANVPAPGHSAQDRSVSLLLTDNRVVIHGFGGSDWRTVRDQLHDRGFIDDAGRLTGGGPPGPPVPRPDPRLRLQTASISGPVVGGWMAAAPPIATCIGAPFKPSPPRRTSASIRKRRSLSTDPAAGVAPP